MFEGVTTLQKLMKTCLINQCHTDCSLNSLSCKVGIQRTGGHLASAFNPICSSLTSTAYELHAIINNNNCLIICGFGGDWQGSTKNLVAMITVWKN